MRTRKNCLTPLAAVAVGLLAGAVGTVCLDTVQYLKPPPQRPARTARWPGNSRR